MADPADPAVVVVAQANLMEGVANPLVQQVLGAEGLPRGTPISDWLGPAPWPRSLPASWRLAVWPAEPVAAEPPEESRPVGSEPRVEPAVEARRARSMWRAEPAIAARRARSMLRAEPTIAARRAGSPAVTEPSVEARPARSVPGDHREARGVDGQAVEPPGEGDGEVLVREGSRALLPWRADELSETEPRERFWQEREVGATGRCCYHRAVEFRG